MAKEDKLTYKYGFLTYDLTKRLYNYEKETVINFGSNMSDYIWHITTKGNISIKQNKGCFSSFYGQYACVDMMYIISIIQNIYSNLEITKHNNEIRYCGDYKDNIVSGTSTDIYYCFVDLIDKFIKFNNF